MPARNLKILHTLPLFVVAVSLVFALIFTIILLPVVKLISPVDVQLLFIVLLVVSATVSSAVALLFYLIIAKKI